MRAHTHTHTPSDCDKQAPTPKGPDRQDWAQDQDQDQDKGRCNRGTLRVHLPWHLWRRLALHVCPLVCLLPWHLCNVCECRQQLH